jgi:hypothetical protein
MFLVTEGVWVKRYVLVGAFPDWSARISETRDVPDLMRKWRQRYGLFAPVVAHKVDTEAVFEALELLGFNISRLPKTLPLARAADLLGWAPVDSDVVKPVLSHLRQLGPHAGPLLSEWGTAARGTGSLLG